MPQLDRFLGVMMHSRADALLLNESDAAALEIDGAVRPVTKQPLTGPQILMLLREIAPAENAQQLEAGEETTFSYQSSEGRFVASARQAEGRWTASVRRSGNGGAPSGGPANGAAVGHAGAPAGAPAAVTAAPRHGGTDPASRATNAAPREASPAVTVRENPAAEAAARERMETLLRLMVEREASDLHLRCGEPPILRQHGEMLRIDGEGALEDAELSRMLLSIMPERNRHEYHELNDTDFAHEIEGVARFRANALRERKGAAAVFRVIPATVVTVEQMGVSPEVQRLCYLTKGLVLVTGPTGSGKSTTLCALVDLVNRVRNDHVITIEDPIEFVHPNKSCIITQRQVGVHTSSFKHALRAALREDPDIVLVGELRDLETVSIAIETAETGHLVFGTLHTTTAASTVDRVIDQFPPDRQEQIRVMLSESLKGVISQTLCKKIGGGRVAAREILLSIPAVSNLIREGKTFQIPSVMQTSRRLGMITMNDALIELVDAKQVEPKEAYMKAVDKVSFLNMLRQRSHDTSFAEGDMMAAAPGKPEPGKPGGGPGGAGSLRPAPAGKR